MSYILDALKKSDQERQNHNGPTLQTLHRPQVSRSANSTTTILLVLIVLLLLIGVGFATWYVFFNQLENTNNLGQPQLSQSQPVKPLPQQVPTSKVAENSAQLGAVNQSQQMATPKPTTAVTPSPILAFDELPDNVRAAIPALTFSFHVYSAKPERRTIIINGRRVKEGDLVTSSLKLEEITEQGVVLDWDAHRFYINVVENW